MAIEDLNETDDTDVFNPDDPLPNEKGKAKDIGPLYRVYPEAKVAVGRGTGKFWQTQYQAALRAYEIVYTAHREALRYYNHNQIETMVVDGVGTYKRGDSTENVIMSNLNILVPAVYSQNPTVTCNTTSKSQEPFCECIASVINTLFRRKDKLDAKAKIKKQVGLGLLTDFGVLRLDWTKKSDSRELAQQELIALTAELAKAKSPTEVDTIYGKFEALEQAIETFKPAGASLDNIHPLRLLIDPYAEAPDGTDGNWMMERCWMRTSMLVARYTIPDPETQDEGSTDEEKKQRTLAFKPTHKAVFGESSGGSRDDGLGLVLDAIGAEDVVLNADDAERQAYLNLYYTECVLVWDKTTRRALLFHRDDWAWPIWVWDDPLSITRFFPYFILSFIMGTGGTMKPGETAYYLDQQDEINSINKQVRKIRRTIYKYFLYNSDLTNGQEMAKFMNAMNSHALDNDNVEFLGIKGGDTGDVSKMLFALTPPQLQFKEMFNKEPILASVNRMTSVNDALRGEQFKTNTTEDAVQTYQESMRISIGSKVDCVEDSMSDLAEAIAELCVMNYSPQDIADLIGPELSKDWQEMDIATFRAKYNIDIVAGSTEKPNSAFKKKEAIQIAQSVGQFAQGAPGAAMKIMLRALQSAFTDLVIKQDDWDMLEKEINATMMKGNNAPPDGAAAGGGSPDALMQAAMSLPEQDKQQIMAMKQQGASPQDILAFIQQKVSATSNGGAPASGASNGQATYQ